MGGWTICEFVIFVKIMYAQRFRQSHLYATKVVQH